MLNDLLSEFVVVFISQNTISVFIYYILVFGSLNYPSILILCTILSNGASLTSFCSIYKRLVVPS